LVLIQQGNKCPEQQGCIQFPKVRNARRGKWSRKIFVFNLYQCNVSVAGCEAGDDLYDSFNASTPSRYDAVGFAIFLPLKKIKNIQ
jgi:hypothetical protein